jgi:hypothetical protein
VAEAQAGAAPPTARTPRWPWVAIVVVLVLAYVTSALLYAGSTGGRRQLTADDIPRDGVLVTFDIQDVEPERDRLAVDLFVEPGEELVDDNGFLVQDVRLVVVPTSGSQSFTFDAGSLLGAARAELLLEGDVRRWPFDTYAPLSAPDRPSSMRVVAFTLDPTTGEPVNLPVNLQIWLQAEGWNAAGLEATRVGGADDAAVDVAFTLKRAVATKAFAMVMLAIMITLPVLGLFVAINVYRGRRKLEATLASFLGAMLFAVVPLRNYLPGAPPPGAWVDVTIVVWVIAAMVLSLVVFVAAWWRHGSPPDAPGSSPRSPNC